MSEEALVAGMTNWLDSILFNSSLKQEEGGFFYYNISLDMLNICVFILVACMYQFVMMFGIIYSEGASRSWSLYTSTYLIMAPNFTYDIVLSRKLSLVTRIINLQFSGGLIFWAQSYFYSSKFFELGQILAVMSGSCF